MTFRGCYVQFHQERCAGAAPVVHGALPELSLRAQRVPARSKLRGSSGVLHLVVKISLPPCHAATAS